MITDRKLGKLCPVMEKICQARWFWWWWHWGGGWDGWQWGLWTPSLCQISSSHLANKSNTATDNSNRLFSKLQKTWFSCSDLRYRHKSLWNSRNVWNWKTIFSRGFARARQYENHSNKNSIALWLQIALSLSFDLIFSLRFRLQTSLYSLCFKNV